MKKQPVTPTTERRFIPGSLEIRAAASDGTPSRTVRGYAAKYGQRSQNLGDTSFQFFEIIEAGAFDPVLGDDVRALFNHDPSQILARSRGGEMDTLRIGTDETGLWYEFDAPQTRAGDDLLESIRRGDVDQSSFGFSVNADGQKWEETRDGETTIVLRTIRAFARLFDVSPVTYPAYLDTSVALRSFEEAKPPTPPEPPAPENSPKHGWHPALGLYQIEATN